MKKPVRRVAACLISVAVIVFVLCVESAAAKGCQESCDADLQACQFTCANDVNVAAACGSDEVCYNDCLNSCWSAWSSCSINKMTCGTPQSAGCNTILYGGWQTNDNWVVVFDPEDQNSAAFFIECVSW